MVIMMPVHVSEPMIGGVSRIAVFTGVLGAYDKINGLQISIVILQMTAIFTQSVNHSNMNNF